MKRRDRREMLWTVMYQASPDAEPVGVGIAERVGDIWKIARAHAGGPIRQESRPDWKDDYERSRTVTWCFPPRTIRRWLPSRGTGWYDAYVHYRVR